LAPVKPDLAAGRRCSRWPADPPAPGGWAGTGGCAGKAECDAYLEETWTDMRPRSLRITLGGE
jgi:MbtH protein